jgi:hypothetical protein
MTPQTSSNVFNTAAAAITSRFISDPQGKTKELQKISLKNIPFRSNY